MFTMNRSLLVAKSYEKKNYTQLTGQFALCINQVVTLTRKCMFTMNRSELGAKSYEKKELHTVYWAICSMYQLLEIFLIVEKSSEHCHKMVNSSKISKSN